LTDACQTKIQEAYHLHRSTRFEAQKKKLLDPDFNSLDLDSILVKLVNPDKYPGFKDDRHVLVFWARPTAKVKSLVSLIQQKILAYLPNAWPVPLENLHMTTMEIACNKTETEIAEMISEIEQDIQRLADWTCNHRARLIKPALGFDASAIALTFVPAAGEAVSIGRTAIDDGYSFHHLRKDMYDECTAAGATIRSRYIVNTSHITVARFVSEEDFQTPQDKGRGIDHAKVKEFVSLIEDINAWLQENYWPKTDSAAISDGGEWIVGEELGLDLRNDVAWYGGGKRVVVGKGF
jgi:vesicle-fusing ATPase